MVEGTHPLRFPIFACLENGPEKRPSADSEVFNQLNFDILRCVEDLKPLYHNTFEVYFNIAICGFPGSGKSSYLERYISGQYSIDEKVLSFPREDRYTKYFEIDQFPIKADMWTSTDIYKDDLSLEKHPRGFTHIHGCLIVMDVTEKHSLHDVWTILNGTKHYQSPETPFVLVGTKCDLEEEREVSLADMEKIVKGCDLQGCVEVSSKTGYNVEKPIDLLINHMLACHIKQRIYQNEGEDVRRIR